VTRSDGQGDHRHTAPTKVSAPGTGLEPDGADSETLALALAQLDVCLRDGARLVRMGRQHFDDDWLTRRAAKNIVTEFAETANRLPEAFKRRHPQVPWRAVNGMRNRIVHVYATADPDIIWNVLAREFPVLGDQLGRPAG
jgi:uncharacterized protein with HEPN domain